MVSPVKSKKQSLKRAKMVVPIRKRDGKRLKSLIFRRFSMESQA